MTEDLDDLVRRVDPDRWLSSRFIADPQARADVVTLYAYDYELARAPRVASNPLLGEIRLTWWREVLDEIFEMRPVRRHPTAQALAALVAARGLPREPLERMIDARYRELDAELMTAEEALAWARDTGGVAAYLAARLLGTDAAGNAAGAAWSLGKRGLPIPDQLKETARREAAALDPQAFPAVAHASLALRPVRTEIGRRLRLTWAVARGRI